MTPALGYASVASPFGSRRLCLATREGKIWASELTGDEKLFVWALRNAGFKLDRSEPAAREAASQVRAYFGKRRKAFELELELEGTPLEVDAWNAVAGTKAGDLASYVELARAIGRPRAHRGVARAMARSPLDLFIPAHRILGADGCIKGDAAQTATRRLLLAFEGHRISKAGRVTPRAR